MNTKRPYHMILCDTHEGRYAWIARLRVRGFNHFVLFKEVRGLAIQCGVADWVQPGQVYVNR